MSHFIGTPPPLSFTGRADPHHADQSVAAVYFDGGEFFDVAFVLGLFGCGVAEAETEGSDAGDDVDFEVCLALQAEEVGEFFIEEHRAAAGQHRGDDQRDQDAGGTFAETGLFFPGQGQVDDGDAKACD